MTRWCPVCESPGVPVVRRHDERDELAEVVEVSSDLPGIDPSHFCSRCPTFFRSKDRFFLTARHGVGVHGITVWPHGERHLSIEVGEDGLVATFHDGASVLISRDDMTYVATNFFQRSSEREIETWARRRGFGLRVVTARAGTADLVVDRPGPHFMLLVFKSWFQIHEIRHTEDGIDHLESVGVEPVLFPPSTVPAS